MHKKAGIGRRNFLKLIGTSLAALPFNLLSHYRPDGLSFEMPNVSLDDIPQPIRAIIQQIPKVEIRPDGLLWIWDADQRKFSQSPLVQTQWNLERYNSFEKLFSDKAWGIVLHWFGITFNSDQSLAAYLRGFNGLRSVGDYQTRTSAHFLVGEADADQTDSLTGKDIGIVQTQLPAPDGIPLVASHLSGLDYAAHEQKQQYFVRAFYELGYFDPSIHSIITEMYDGRRLDPNYRTIAIEMTGSYFDQVGNAPPVQQTANVVGLIYALMRRYQISALDLFGHHELELRKSDPGKQYMALIRQLIGIYALYAKDEQFFKLVFGNFITDYQDAWSGVLHYFIFIRDYYAKTGYPDQVYQWEAAVNYWNVMNHVNAKRSLGTQTLQTFTEFLSPLTVKTALKKDRFLSPPGHEGIDLFSLDNRDIYDSTMKIGVYLPAIGQCIQVLNSSGCGSSYSVIFRHLQKDGAEIITVFSNLENIVNLKRGKIYAAGQQIGDIAAGGPLGEGFLHFAIAYGATWDTFLKNQSNLPHEMPTAWIRRRYIDPQRYLASYQSGMDTNSLFY